MNQQKALQLLNSIMPEISSNGNPDEIMLKCARKNNLSPAQFEKLAQVFNTMKTNWTMDHQANRGDSFSLVNVPELLHKYATYDPELYKEASEARRGFNADADRFFTSIKMAGTDDKKLPALAEMFVEQGGRAVMDSDEDTMFRFTSGPSYDVTHTKAASAAPAQETAAPTRRQIERAREKASQVRYETSVELFEKLSAIKKKFTPDNGKWAEAVHDIFYGMGKEAAATINLIEDFFDREKHQYKGADLTKQSSTILVHDRHNVFRDVQEIMELCELQKQAKSVLEKVGAGSYYRDFSGAPTDDVPGWDLPRKKKSGGSSDGFDLMGGVADVSNTVSNEDINKLVENIVAPKKLTADEKKWKDNMMNRTKRDTTLQQLLMSDRILREADPHMVQDLFNTIADISPTMANNHLLMGPVLKEALQYEAVPTQMIKDLVAIEKDQATRSKDQVTIDRDKYGR